jgi:hypothetical protein
MNRLIAALLAAPALLPLCANAQTYPAKSIRIVVPFPPGAFTEHIRNEVAKWGKVVKATGARVE